MGTRLTRVGVVIGILIASLVVFDRCFADRLSEWEQRAQAAETLNGALQERVNDLQAEADSLRSQAVEIVEVVVPRISETDSMVAALPPAETPGEAQRDTVIVRLTGERDSLLVANRILFQSNDRLQEALDVMTVARDSLLAVVEDRPGPRPWWIPELTVGASAVLDDGAVEIKVPAVTLGWKISL